MPTSTVNFDATITVACTSIATLLLSECKSPSSFRSELPWWHLLSHSFHFHSLSLIFYWLPGASSAPWASVCLPEFSIRHLQWSTPNQYVIFIAYLFLIMAFLAAKAHFWRSFSAASGEQWPIHNLVNRFANTTSFWFDTFTPQALLTLTNNIINIKPLNIM